MIDGRIYGNNRFIGELVGLQDIIYFHLKSMYSIMSGRNLKHFSILLAYGADLNECYHP